MNQNNLPFPIPNLEYNLKNLEQLFGNITNINHQQTEQYLLPNRTNFEHIISLIEYLKIPQIQKNQSLACVIELKNIFKIHYQNFSQNMNDSNLMIYNYIKYTLVGLYLTLPSELEIISNLLMECIRIIIKSDFPEKWPELLKQLSSNLQNNNHFGNFKIFTLLYKITKKYEYSSRSDKLYSEIILVTEEFHEHIIFYAKGYIMSIMQNNFDVIYLNNLVIILRIVYNLIYQDIHEYIEDNIGNWVKLLKDVLSPEFHKAFEIALNREEKIETREKILNYNFICKGEVIKIILLFSTKYKEDFEDHIKNFAEDIWNNCISIPLTSDKNEKTKLLINSVKYFKSFSQNKDYFNFFKEKMHEIISKLIIPGFMPSESDHLMFEEEAKAFTENTFSLIYSGNKSKQVISDFIETLSRFYRDDILVALESILGEILNQRSFSNLSNEIVYIQIFINAVVRSSNSKNGANEIVCSQDTLDFIYSNLIETFLSDFLKNCHKMDPHTLMNSFFLISYHMKFISLFKNFLNFDKIFRNVAELFMNTFHFESDTYKYCLLSLTCQLLDRYEFELKNNLNAQLDDLSYYQKFYMNPRKMSLIYLKDPKNNKIPIKLSNDNYSYLVKILETIYISLTKNKCDINVYLLQLLSDILDKTDIENMKKIEEPFKEMVHSFLNGLNNNLIISNSSLVNKIFKILETFIEKSQNVNFEEIEEMMISLMKKGIEFTNLSLQIFAILLKKKNLKITQNNLYKNLFENCFNPFNYKGEMLGAVPAYLIFIKNAVMNENNLIENWTIFSEILFSMLSNKMITLHYSFIKDLLIKNINPENLINQAFIGLKTTIENNEMTVNFSELKDNFIKQILYGCFLETICIFVNLYSFQDFFNLLIKLQIVELFCGFITSSDFFAFLSKFSNYDSRNFVILILSKILFEESEVFFANNLKKEFLALINSIIDNIWCRKNQSKDLTRNYTIKKKEKDAIDILSENAFSNVFILRNSENENSLFIKSFLIEARKNIDDFDKFILQKFADLIQNCNIPFDQVLMEAKYMELFKN